MNKTQIEKGIKIIQEGGIVIYPTDTAFGIGCRIDYFTSVDRLFALRKRPLTKAAPVLVSSVDMALAYFQNSTNVVRHLMETYWPGALTIIYTCRTDVVYSPIRGGGNTIGLRMPNHIIPRKLIEEIGVPILGPSANFHGDVTPYKRKDLNPELIKLADFVIDGDTKESIHSTVVDCTVNPFKIVREGAITL